jgi:hypothetical protein
MSHKLSRSALPFPAASGSVVFETAFRGEKGLFELYENTVRSVGVARHDLKEGEKYQEVKCKTAAVKREGRAAEGERRAAAKHFVTLNSIDFSRPSDIRLGGQVIRPGTRSV